MSQFDFTEEELEAAPKVPFALGNFTVVSLLPYPLKEHKPSIIPGYFQIPKSDTIVPSVLPVGASIHWMESPFAGNPPPPPVKMTHPPEEIAKAIVNDFLEAQLGIESDAMPGLFYVEGHQRADDIITKHNDKLKEAKHKQNRWFSTLIRIADDDWSKYHQHNFISDLQRYAAKSMGLDKEWLSTALNEIQVQCPLCKDYVREDAIIHSACGFIMKQEEYKKLQSQGLILEVTR